jgi:serine/threonine protein kinase
LEDLHNVCKIAHRDIKPSNILFSKKRNCWVYADFGVSQLFGREGVSNDFDEHTIAGTALYMCPE